MQIIDNGVGSDLVCVGEQPLHAVPLLKFHNKDASPNAVDDYSMPHWINLSFYSTNKKVAYSTFIPRIKLPPLVQPQPVTNGGEHTDDTDQQQQLATKLSGNTPATEYIHNSLFDYDAYDAQIFTIPPAHGSLQRNGGGSGAHQRTKKTSVPSLDGFGVCTTADWEPMSRTQPITMQSTGMTSGGGAGLSASMSSFRRKMSDPDIHHGIGFGAGLSPSGNGNHGAACISESMSHLERQGLGGAGGGGNGKAGSASPLHHRSHGGAHSSSAAALVRPGRALINPFAPSHVTIKLTSNRRRWTHIFPKGPTGVLIQQHHYQAMPTPTTLGGRRSASQGYGNGTATSLTLQDLDATTGGVYGSSGGGGSTAGGEAFGAYYSSNGNGGHYNEGTNDNFFLYSSSSIIKFRLIIRVI